MKVSESPESSRLSPESFLSFLAESSLLMLSFRSASVKPFRSLIRRRLRMVTNRLGSNSVLPYTHSSPACTAYKDFLDGQDGLLIGQVHLMFHNQCAHNHAGRLVTGSHVTVVQSGIVISLYFIPGEFISHTYPTVGFGKIIQ